MDVIIETLQFPFVYKALLAGLILSILASVMGVLTLIRKAAFYGDAIAHSSLAGVAIGLSLGIYPLVTAFGYAILVALLLPTFRDKLRLSLDNVLGIVLPVSMGIGVLIFSMLPGFQPEMMSFLFGNILTITNQEIYLLLFLFVVSVLLFVRFLPLMLFNSIDSEYAQIMDLKVSFLEKLYEVLLAITVIAGVKLLGVVLINALLIIPASAAKLIAKSLKQWVILTMIISVISVLGGIIVSLILNTPPGASIAVFSGVILGLIFLIKELLG